MPYFTLLTITTSPCSHLKSFKPFSCAFSLHNKTVNSSKTGIMLSFYFLFLPLLPGILYSFTRAFFVIIKYLLHTGTVLSPRDKK